MGKGYLKAGRPGQFRRVHVSGGSTEGSLGRLAGAAAGGAQGMLAAGARSTFSCIPCRAGYPLSTSRATTHQFPAMAQRRKERHKEFYRSPSCFSLRLCALRELLIPHGDLSLESDRFLVIRIDRYRAQRILARLTAIAPIEKDPSQKDVRVDQFRIPEDRSLERRDGGFLIAATKIDSSAEQVSLGVCRFDHYDPMQFGKCFVVASSLIKIPCLDQQILRRRAWCLGIGGRQHLGAFQIENFIAIQDIAHA